jgi:hypothetical protein
MNIHIISLLTAGYPAGSRYRVYVPVSPRLTAWAVYAVSHRILCFGYTAFCL